ncbi:MAG: ComF family protein [Chloroflexota bacterium]|jgi:ComF family protein|nr:ComF family protein [Chloroflexota bacterium]
MKVCIRSLKYDHNQSLGEYFSRDLLACVEGLNWPLELVIPVPLSPFRIKERGYNQSALLARPLAMSLSLNYQPYALKRIRNTRSQVELSATERRINVEGAFQAVPELVRGKSVLLVDDVTTTGSTLNECSRALTLGGASAVYCLTLARPIHDESLV